MDNNNTTFNINRLILIGAILTLLGDFIDLVIAIQEYRSGSNQNSNDSTSEIPFLFGPGRRI